MTQHRLCICCKTFKRLKCIWYTEISECIQNLKIWFIFSLILSLTPFVMVGSFPFEFIIVCGLMALLNVWWYLYALKRIQFLYKTSQNNCQHSQTPTQIHFHPYARILQPKFNGPKNTFVSFVINCNVYPDKRWSRLLMCWTASSAAANSLAMEKKHKIVYFISECKKRIN